MTHPEFYVKQGDTSPAIESRLEDDEGDPVDISGYTAVSFHMKPKDADTVKVNDDDSGNVTVVDPANGLVKYEWQSGDTDTSGRFEAEWQVTYADGTEETFPNTRNISVRVVPEIA